MGRNVVIGLAGVKTAGKSTVTNILKKHLDLREAALAQKLKDVSAAVFNIPRSHFDDQKYKEVSFDVPKVLGANEIISILEKFGISYREFVERQVLSSSDGKHPYASIVGMLLESPRKVAQIVGTEVLRLVGEDIHCESVELYNGGVTVVSDMRFPNEYAYFAKNTDITFIPIYIKRDIAEAQVTENSHPSETSVFQFTNKCFRVDNNGSLEDTEAQLVAILKNYQLNNVTPEREQ